MASSRDSSSRGMDAEDIIAAISAVLASTSGEACIAAFKSPLLRFDIDTFASGEVDVSDRRRSIFHAIDWPDDWRRFYFASGMLDRDPLLGALARRVAPFTWAELRADRSLPTVGTEGLERASEAGWTDGLVVHMPRGGTRYGLVSLVARRTAVTERHKTLLAPLCICFHDRMRGLVAGPSLAAPPLGLTAREPECVRLVVSGFTDREIAERLGIAASTAHDHVESARKRFGGATRSQMAAAAISLGVVHPEPLRSPLFSGE